MVVLGIACAASSSQTPTTPTATPEPSKEVFPAIGIGNAPPKPEHLVFKSGFENDVVIKLPHTIRNEWKQVILVRNREAGLSPMMGGQFTYNVPDIADIDEYIATRLETVLGPAGEPTTALYMETKKYHPLSKRDLGGYTRQEYIVYPPQHLTEVYSRYWIKLQPDLGAMMPPGDFGWRMLMEWKEESDTGPIDYRWSLVINREPKKSDDLFWTVKAERGSPGPTDWKVENFDVPVLPGEWFLLEVYWRHSADDDGRVWIAVDGQTIVDHRGRNKIDSEISPWSPFKAYTGTEMLDRGPAYQWIDDVEVYASEPISSE